MSADARVEVAAEVDAAEIEAMANAVLEALDLADAELSVLLTTDAHIAQLNATYRGVEGPTDVLSFPQEAMPGAPRVLGDVVVGLGRAAAQAAERGHSLRDELWVLIVHGVLHLCGHDHEDDEERAAMLAAEQRLLAAVGRSLSAGLVGRAGEG